MLMHGLFAQELFDSVFLYMIQKCLRLILVLSSPMLLAAIVTGIAIAMFQAVTKIQEQTLSFIPKIVATFWVLVVYAPEVRIQCQEFLIETFGYIAKMQPDAVLK